MQQGQFQAAVLNSISYSKSLTIIIQTAALDPKDQRVKD